MNVENGRADDGGRAVEAERDGVDGDGVVVVVVWLVAGFHFIRRSSIRSSRRPGDNVIKLSTAVSYKFS